MIQEQPPKQELPHIKMPPFDLHYILCNFKISVTDIS